MSIAKRIIRKVRRQIFFVKRKIDEGARADKRDGGRVEVL